MIHYVLELRLSWPGSLSGPAHGDVNELCTESFAIRFGI